MKQFNKNPLSVAVASISLAAGASMNVHALELEEVVVTATQGDTTMMESSISVTDVSAEAIADFTPRSEAEVLLMIPGIRAENTGGGGGNSNITVRGLPIAAGGSKYVQLQEDGLPVVLFGDMNFGNNDYWVRYDYTVNSVQAVRGGSSSTLASQAPGAVINYISKTGEEPGGSIGMTRGLDYDETRLDFEYGSPLTDTLRFHVGGFYRTGEGPREASFNLLDGYQFKANITKEFEDGSGYVRFYFKKLDEQAPTYTSYPQTANLSGDTVSDFGTFPGFDARSDTNVSKHNRTFLAVNSAGETIVANVDGIHPDVTGFGVEISKTLSDNWTLQNRFRNNEISGTWTAPFMNVVPFEDFVAGYSVTVADGTTFNAAEARYANGPLAGQVVTVDNLANPFINTNPTPFVEMQDMGNYANDLSLTGNFEFGDSLITTTLGYFRSGQSVKSDWHINESIAEANGNDPAMIDLFDDAGNRLTDNGRTGYNNQWGACCARQYDIDYTVDAVYLAVNYATGPLDLDVSVRQEYFDGDGSFAGTGVQQSLDVDGDGELSVAERNVFVADISNAFPVDQELDYTSWSIGANFMLTDDLSLFGRASEGNRVVADRLPDQRSNWIDGTGKLTAQGEKTALNEVNQQELGAKYRGDLGIGDYALFATLFHSEVDEFSTDLTVVPPLKIQSYETYGIEFESTVNIGDNFAVNLNVTYTDAEIVEDAVGGNSGNTPLATPDWMYLIAPTYSFERGAVGMTLRGITETYSNDGNGLKIEGEYFINAFARYDLLEGLEVSVNINNLLDEWGQAGRLDQGSPADVAALGALLGGEAAVANRPQLGRTVSASLRYSF